MSTTPISWVVVAVPVAAAEPVEPVPDVPRPPKLPALPEPEPPRQPVADGVSAGEAWPTTVVVPLPATCTPTNAPAAMPRAPAAPTAPTTTRRRRPLRGAGTGPTGYPAISGPLTTADCCTPVSSTGSSLGGLPVSRLGLRYEVPGSGAAGGCRPVPLPSGRPLPEDPCRRCTTNRSPARSDLSDSSDPAVLYVRSYLLTRTVVGVLGVLLPVALVAGEAFGVPGPVQVRDSLSAYYHTGCRTSSSAS